MMRPTRRDLIPPEAPLRARAASCLCLAQALLCAAVLSFGAGCSEDNPCQVPSACPVLSCVPSESATPVGDVCGVFVSPSLGVDDALGSKAKPFKSIKAAVAVVTTKRIYLCAEEIQESVTLRPGFRVYGGLNCGAGWGWAEGSQSVLTAEAGAIPLTVAGEAMTEPEEEDTPSKIPDGGDGTSSEQDPLILEDLRIVAKDAVDEGGSSIAIVAYDALIRMTRSRVEAGSGADGRPGEGVVQPATSGLAGNAGKAACSADTVLGGDEVANACVLRMPSVGGTGGLGSTSGGSGATGLPDLGQSTGLGGKGADSLRPCAAGQVGSAGAVGAAGEGALGPGSIGRMASGVRPGYVGVSGKDGAPGSPGQGGGGGGGSQGGAAADKCSDMASDGGASGGSGGAGGCGGLGGKGGGPGGSSFAILSLNSTLAFDKTTVVVKKGGKGGDGGAGQPGGSGGTGGVGGEVPAGSTLLPGCAGGNGGPGGVGGRGGGGQGGHSIGIAFIGRSPPSKGLSIEVGTPGAGGAGEGQGGSGAPGKSPKTLRFGE
ncbi:MAG TPA: PGRS family protein [Polyangiaceae bacterium]|nr:PGRS family protein [Polyangiaceae bacterium]